MTTEANVGNFTFALEGTTLSVLRFEGIEPLSRLFRFRIELVQEIPAGVGDALDPLQWVGTNATLTVQGSEHSRKFHGIVEQFCILSVSKARIAYEAILVPSLSLLTLNQNCRIFQDTSTPDIIATVLANAGFRDRLELALFSHYPPRNYCVQYRESDWAFITRLMEEEGIFFRFHHLDRDVLFLGDGPHAYGDSGNITFRQEANTHPLYQESIRFFHSGKTLKATSSTLRDYSFKRPLVDLEAQHQGDSSFQGGERYTYPGEYVEHTIGNRLVRVRQEEAQAEGRWFRAGGNTRQAASGDVFRLGGHPVAEMNRPWLVTEVEHSGEQVQSLEEESTEKPNTYIDYQVRLRGVPAEVSWRPHRTTPRPAVPGLHSAVVVCPEGETVHTDGWGRVKVKFHWDRAPGADDTSSCWIRVNQPWAGARFGGMFLPRVDHEVWVHFLEGDPDRPIIVGRVHNDREAVPYKLPERRTLSTLKTRSVGGDGFNELRFEDAAGKEEIYVHGQKDWNIVIRNTKGEIIGKRKRLRVRNNHLVKIGRNRRERIGKNETSLIAQNRTQFIGMNDQVTIGVMRTEQIGKDDYLSIGADHHIVVGHDAQVKVGGYREEKIRGSFSLESGTNIHYTSIKKHLILEAADTLKLECPGCKLELKADGTINIEGSVTVGLKGETDVRIKGGVLKLN